MTKPVGYSKGVAGAIAMTGIIAGVFVILGFLPENGLWGLNHLSFYSTEARLFFGILAVAALLPASGRFFCSIANALARLPNVAQRTMFLLIPAALFVFARVSIHFLGDGYQRAFEIEHGKFYLGTEFLDYAIHALFYRVLNLLGTFPATTAMAGTSILAGIIFVYMVWALTPFSGLKRTLFFLMILSMGSSQLFFGYVESYTLLYFSAVWYLLLLFQSAEREASFTTITIAYVLAGLSHQVGIILLPSYLYAGYVRFKAHPRRVLPVASALLASTLPIVVPWALNQLARAEQAKRLADYILPLWGDVYSVFASAHLLDIGNEFLLIAPIILMVTPLLPRVLGQSNGRVLTITLVVPALAFVLVVNPELTLVRDWDLFAVPVAVAVIPLLLLLCDSIRDTRITNVLLRSALVASIVLSAWVGVNHGKERGLHRSEYALDHSIKGKSYGYELLAYYFNSQGDLAEELRLIQKIPQAEWTARVYAKAARAQYFLGHYDEAYELAQKGVLLPDPVHLNAHMAGTTAYDRRDYPTAIHYLRVAMALRPDDMYILCQLGDALRDADSLAAATEVYRQVMRQDGGISRSYFGMAFISCRRGEYDLASKYYQEGMRRDAGDAMASVVRQMIEGHR